MFSRLSLEELSTCTKAENAAIHWRLMMQEIVMDTILLLALLTLTISFFEKAKESCNATMNSVRSEVNKKNMPLLSHRYEESSMTLLRVTSALTNNPIFTKATRVVSS